MPENMSNEDNRMVSQPKKTKRPRRRGGALSFILFIGIIVAIGLFAWAEQQRRTVEGRLKQTEQQLEEIQKSTQRSGQEVADQVLQQVRTLIEIPEDPQPTVATIVDVERLRQTSDFYNKAKNGDHLIITENRAILYDPDKKVIIDVVPVQINQEAASPTPAANSEEGTIQATPTATPAPSPTPES